MAVFKSGLVPQGSTGASIGSYKPGATSIAFSTPPVTLLGAGSTSTVRAVVLDQKLLPMVPQPVITYASTAVGIATVSASGLVSGVAAGSAQVKASVVGLTDASLAVTVGAVAAPIPAPVLTSITPSSYAQNTTANSFTLSGTFPADYVLELAGLTGVSIADSARNAGGTSITGHVTVAANAPIATGTIRVNSPTAGPSATKPVSVTAAVVVPAPTITSITPNSITQGASNVAFTMPGTNIPTDYTLALGGLTGVTINDSVRVSATQITGHVSATATATSNGGTIQLQSATAGPSNFLPITVTASAPPTSSAPVLTSVAPGSIAQGETRNVVLTGSRFDSTCSVLATGLSVFTRAAAAAVPPAGPFDSASNQWTFPRDFTNAAWGHPDVTVTAGAAVGPDGVAASATRLNEVATNTSHDIYRGVTVPAIGQIATVAYEFKDGNRGYAGCRFNDSNIFYDYIVNLTTGATVSKPADGVVQIKKLPNGWWIVEFQHPTRAATVYASAVMSNGTTLGYLGDVTKYIYIGGAQAEGNVSGRTFDMFTGSDAVTASPSIDSATQITASVTAAAAASIGNHAVTVHSSTNGDSGAVQLAVASGVPAVPTAGNATSATSYSLTFPVTIAASGAAPTKIKPYFYNGTTYVANSYGNADITVTVAQGATQQVTLTGLPASATQTISFAAANAIGESAGAANVTGTTTAAPATRALSPNRFNGDDFSSYASTTALLAGYNNVAGRGLNATNTTLDTTVLYNGHNTAKHVETAVAPTSGMFYLGGSTPTTARAFCHTIQRLRCTYYLPSNRTVMKVDLGGTGGMGGTVIVQARDNGGWQFNLEIRDSGGYTVATQYVEVGVPIGSLYSDTRFAEILVDVQAIANGIKANLYSSLAGNPLMLVATVSASAATVPNDMHATYMTVQAGADVGKETTANIAQWQSVDAVAFPNEFGTLPTVANYVPVYVPVGAYSLRAGYEINSEADWQNKFRSDKGTWGQGTWGDTTKGGTNTTSTEIFGDSSNLDLLQYDPSVLIDGKPTLFLRCVGDGQCFENNEAKSPSAKLLMPDNNRLTNAWVRRTFRFRAGQDANGRYYGDLLGDQSCIWNTGTPPATHGQNGALKFGPDLLFDESFGQSGRITIELDNGGYDASGRPVCNFNTNGAINNVPLTTLLDDYPGGRGYENTFLWDGLDYDIIVLYRTMPNTNPIKIVTRFWLEKHGQPVGAPFHRLDYTYPAGTVLPKFAQITPGVLNHNQSMTLTQMMQFNLTGIEIRDASDPAYRNPFGVLESDLTGIL